jgi:hypothetical protein
MRRSLRPGATLVALLCALVLPSAALAASASSPGVRRPSAKSGQLVGTIIAIHGASLTVQASGRRIAVIDALTAAANDVTAGDYPYVYGGGHPEAGIPNTGIPGPGYNGRRTGFDCSGSVAAVLAGGGLWQSESGVPADNGIIAQLLSEHLIARGPGHGATEVTLYDDPGVHIFMRINGRFFGTSDGYAENDAQPRGGAGWLNDGSPDTTRRIYRRYHVLPWLLKRATTYGRTLTFKAGGSAGRLRVGERVRVSYTQTPAGSMTARAVRDAG